MFKTLILRDGLLSVVLITLLCVSHCFCSVVPTVSKIMENDQNHNESRNGSTSFGCKATRAAPKVMPPSLWCWPTTLEMDVGGMAVKAEPSHRYSIPFRYCMTDGSRGAVWQNGIWYGRADEAIIWSRINLIPPCRKNGTHQHSFTLAERLWRPNSACEHSEVVGWVLQQWRQRVTAAGADLDERSMQAPVHLWKKCIGNGSDSVEK